MPTSKPKLPEFLAIGEPARLIPVVSDGSREVRATSILLSTLYAEHEFAQNLFGAAGVRIGSRTNIEVYTEIVFKDNGENTKLRPDGLIIINTGKGQWKALVEAKIGNSELSPAQVKDYLALAKKHHIDAVITISNQYSAIPTHHPIPFKRSDLKGVELYHWSWMFVLTEAILLLKSMGVEDAEQQFLLDEMRRYFEHPKVGAASFTSMNKEWKDVTQKVRSGSRLSKGSEEIENTIASWHQEARDLCLIMSQKLAVPVSLRLSRKHTSNPAERLKDDCEQLVNAQTMSCELDVPNAASPLTVVADLTRRTVDCSMRVEAPKDKQRATARLNWLLRQLKGVNPQDIYIRAITQGRTNNPQALLEIVRENPKAVLVNEGTDIQPTAFEVIMVRDLAGKFGGRNTFIEGVEDTVVHFYEEAGQNLQQWVPSAPKVKKDKAQEETPEKETEEPETVVLMQEQTPEAKIVPYEDDEERVVNE